MEEVQKSTVITKPYKVKLLESDIPQQFKACAMKKINSMKLMNQGGGEYYKIKQWIDSFLQIPFGKVNELPVNITHGVDKCQEFMEQAQEKLNESVYGP